MDNPWLLYGAYGYTGRLIAREAAAQGHRPWLAGRARAPLEALAREMGLPARVVSLEDREGLVALLGEVDLVVHAAGPYVRTAAPMQAACLATGTAYLDLTGEVPVLQATYARDREARRKGVLLLPAVGFDGVPADALAVALARRLPGAQALEIALSPTGSGSSRGTRKTVLELLPRGGAVVRRGRLVPYPLGQGLRPLPFPDGPRWGLPIPAADLLVALRSTGIPEITVYLTLPERQARRAAALLPVLQPLLAIRPLRRLLQVWIDRWVDGPDPEARARGRGELWARAVDARGREVQAWMRTPEGYTFTARAVVAAVERLLPDPPAGALTPSQALGADFPLGLEGVERAFL